ncbi:MAG: peptidylprolyl isomerase [Xanthomonadales bacterium]|jgi:FKBP-type peptidyl-prolyl cis-trans isomerase SlyD|nr:peptidylprolyl isomerase [Xanthomonadales bacterium]
MNIANNRVVSIHYTLTNDAGEVLDSSEGREPLNYLHGAGNIIPGLENALLDKVAGDELNVTVEPEDGYGVRRDELIQKVPREAFQGVDQVEPGMRFQAQTQTGPVMVTVTEVTDTEVTVDGNHELADQRLHFAVKVEGVREATAEEQEHGHVH